MRVFIDTNVIIAAAFGGKPLEAVVQALKNHEVYLSLTIERELREVILGLYIAILTGAAFASILVLWGKKKLSGVIPFGPFLTIGAFLTLFYSGELIHFIYKFLGL